MYNIKVNPAGTPYHHVVLPCFRRHERIPFRFAVLADTSSTMLNNLRRRFRLASTHSSPSISSAKNEHRAHRQRSARMESLEPRLVLTAPTLAALGNQTLSAGAPLEVPINATSPSGFTLSYSVTSTNPAVTADLQTGQSDLVLNITHTASSQPGDVSFSGTIIIELFASAAPNTVAQIEKLAESGAYNGKDFYRIVPDFVAQAGLDGASLPAGVTAPNLNNEFDPALPVADPAQPLQYTSAGVVGLARMTADDTGSTEFFITTTATSSNLDYQYTVFGQVVSGMNILTDIGNVPNNASDNNLPYSPVTITSATISTQQSQLRARPLGAGRHYRQQHGHRHRQRRPWRHDVAKLSGNRPSRYERPGTDPQFNSDVAGHRHHERQHADHVPTFRVRSRGRSDHVLRTGRLELDVRLDPDAGDQFRPEHQREFDDGVGHRHAEQRPGGRDANVFRRRQFRHARLRAQHPDGAAVHRSGRSDGSQLGSGVRHRFEQQRRHHLAQQFQLQRRAPIPGHRRHVGRHRDPHGRQPADRQRRGDRDKRRRQDQRHGHVVERGAADHRRAGFGESDIHRRQFDRHHQSVERRIHGTHRDDRFDDAAVHLVARQRGRRRQAVQLYSAGQRYRDGRNRLQPWCRDPRASRSIRRPAWSLGRPPSLRSARNAVQIRATDAAGNTSLQAFDITVSAGPAVAGVSTTAAANSKFTVGQTIPILVTFGEAVNVTGTPTLTLNDGAVVNYSSGSGTTTLTFNYLVGAGQNVAFLDYASTTALALNGGTIEDSSGTAAVLTLPATGTDGLATKDIIVGNAVAAVADLAVALTASASSLPGGSITYTVTVTNNGPSTAQNVKLIDTLPTTTTYASQSQSSGSSFTLSQSSGVISDTIASLGSGATASFTIMADIPVTTVATSISDTATVSSSTSDSNSANNTATASTTVTAHRRDARHRSEHAVGD